MNLHPKPRTPWLTTTIPESNRRDSAPSPTETSNEKLGPLLGHTVGPFTEKAP